MQRREQHKATEVLSLEGVTMNTPPHTTHARDWADRLANPAQWLEQNTAGRRLIWLWAT